MPDSSYRQIHDLRQWAVFVCCRLAAVVDAAARLLLTSLLAGLRRALAPFPWSCRLGVVSALLAVVSLYLGTFGAAWLPAAAGLGRDHMRILSDDGVLDAAVRLHALASTLGWFLVFTTLAAFVRRRYSLLLLKVAGAGFAVVWFWLLVYAVRVPGRLYHADAELFDKLARNDLWLRGIGAWLPFMVLALLNLVCLCLRSVHEFYGGAAAPSRLAGDEIVDRLRPDRGDRSFRSSYYWAAFLHLAVLFMLPAMIRGCAESPYGIPKGDGPQVVQVVRVKKAKKKDKVVLNLNSAILFYRPDLDDIKVIEDVEEDTQDTYVATTLTGAKGKGKGRGGWPHGMENAEVRFIRMEYAGGDWDQQMGKGADYNFLLQFQKLTGFKIAGSTEHIPIRQLRRFPKHRAPPFVFITGSGEISVGSEDIKTLRWYLLEEGGMLFADNGGGHFNRSFRNLMRSVLPSHEWVDIASDDTIYLQPFEFPRGAPPLWHHSGTRALGMKNEGRWVVFYHQGDMNDAWQTGHSGISEAKAAQAYKMGVNVVNYAFNQYYNMHYK